MIRADRMSNQAHDVEKELDMINLKLDQGE